MRGHHGSRHTVSLLVCIEHPDLDHLDIRMLGKGLERTGFAGSDGLVVIVEEGDDANLTLATNRVHQLFCDKIGVLFVVRRDNGHIVLARRISTGTLSMNTSLMPAAAAFL